MREILLIISFLIMFILLILISLTSEKLNATIDKKSKELEPKEIKTDKIIKVLRLLKNLLIPIEIIVSLLIALPFNFDTRVQNEYDRFINQLSNDLSDNKVEGNTDILIQKFGRKLLQAQEERKQDSGINNKIIEPLKEFPFSIKYDITFPETQVFEIPIWEESEEYTVTVPIELYEYQCEKVPKNEDIHGFIVNDTYYCNDDDSETNIAEYNYYNLADYWLVLHTVEISFKGNEDFISGLDGATIMLKEKESRKAVKIENGYLANSFVVFKCSTGQYIIEIYKNGIIYKSNIFIDESGKKFIDITEKDQYYLAFY